MSYRSTARHWYSTIVAEGAVVVTFTFFVGWPSIASLPAASSRELAFASAAPSGTSVHGNPGPYTHITCFALSVELPDFPSAPSVFVTRPSLPMRLRVIFPSSVATTSAVYAGREAAAGVTAAKRRIKASELIRTRYKSEEKRAICHLRQANTARYLHLE